MIVCHLCPLLFVFAASGAPANIRVKEARHARLADALTIEPYQRWHKWRELIAVKFVKEQLQRTQHLTLRKALDNELRNALCKSAGEKKPRRIVASSKFWLPDLDSNQGPAD
jgi:hypothetical protein